ncbi:MAG: peptidoglycan-binding protein LysM [Gammaproteobacteria bacterium]|nr:peptidoglycan-binding protein LysM [Gammaproteobacteria bacterium]
MGWFDAATKFASNIGKKLFDSEDDAAEKIKAHIEENNPGIENLEIAVTNGVAEVKGEVKEASALEKVLLMTGNVLGIGEVKADDVVSPEPTVEVEYYDIQKGDTLWAIAEKFYGNGSKYTTIVEENQEVIINPDLIFPGQRIRIPK